MPEGGFPNSLWHYYLQAMAVMRRFSQQPLTALFVFLVLLSVRHIGLKIWESTSQMLLREGKRLNTLRILIRSRPWHNITYVTDSR